MSAGIFLLVPSLSTGKRPHRQNHILQLKAQIVVTPPMANRYLLCLIHFETQEGKLLIRVSIRRLWDSTRRSQMVAAVQRRADLLDVVIGARWKMRG